MRICEFKPLERPSEFWEWCAPIFASRGAQAELGSMFVDSDSTTWFVLVGETGVCGLASWRREGDVAWLDNAFVPLEHRRKGFHTMLVERRLSSAALAGARVVRALTNANSNPLYRKLKFLEAGRRGGYTIMEHLTAFFGD